MSDAALRELERAWRASGAVEDEAALVARRLQVGVLERSQVELAAHLGSEAATRVLAVEPEAPATQARSFWERVTGKGADDAYWVDEGAFEAWCNRVEDFGRDARTRVAIAAARVAHTHSVEPALKARWAASLRAVEAWLFDPSQIAGCQRERATAIRAVRGELPGVAASLAENEEIASEEEALEHAGVPIWCLTMLLDFALDLGGWVSEGTVYRLLDNLEQVVADGRRRIRVALEAEVLPWALGQGDPLADRRR